MGKLSLCDVEKPGFASQAALPKPVVVFDEAHIGRFELRLCGLRIDRWRRFDLMSYRN
jgi:hypothetical protein